MSTQAITRTDPIDTLADLPVGTTFRAAGKVYTMADGFQILPAAGRAWFNVVDAGGRHTKVKVTTKTVVTIVGRTT